MPAVMRDRSRTRTFPASSHEIGHCLRAFANFTDALASVRSVGRDLSRVQRCVGGVRTASIALPSISSGGAAWRMRRLWPHNPYEIDPADRNASRPFFTSAARWAPHRRSRYWLNFPRIAE
jgi:hypothetical protein